MSDPKHEPAAPEATTKPTSSAPKDDASATTKKLSNKELKELKKAEKAAKRAAQKSAAGVSAEQQAAQSQAKMDKNKRAAGTVTHLKKQLDQTVIKDDSKKIPSLFSHLESREQRNAASPSISSIIHPEILQLALRYSTYKIVGSTARLTAMLRAFQVVIRDYQTPENTSLTRHLTGHLSNQIDYLVTARPISIPMGNAIRWLKQEISHVPVDESDSEAKAALVAKIDDFIRDKVELSGQVIVDNASQHVAEGATIVTYAHSQVLQQLFIHCAVVQNKHFKLVVADSRPLFEGKRLVASLAATTAPGETRPITETHIEVSYVLMPALSSVSFADVSCVFLGASAMLSNGRLYSRVGTAMIAMMCHTRNIPVLTCCESIKFSDRVQLDSVTTNELADPEDIVANIDSMQPPQKKTFALEQFLKTAEAEQEKPTQQQKKKEKEKSSSANDAHPLSLWKSLDNVTVLNIMYDLTPPEYIKKVITELGALPPSSVPVILREYKNT
ncbi:translation initiation factor eIF2B subunit delta [Diutina catenulata]